MRGEEGWMHMKGHLVQRWYGNCVLWFGNGEVLLVNRNYISSGVDCNVKYTL